MWKVPEIMATIKDLYKVAERGLQSPRKSVAEVALVCDLDSAYYLSDGEGMLTAYKLIMDTTTELYRTGAPFDAILLPQLALLLPDPRELRDGKQAHRLQRRVARRRDADAAVGGVDAQVHVADVLEANLDREAPQLQRRAHQYSGCALTMAKMRSTSPRSCRIS